MLTNITDSVKETIKDRMASPILGSYVLFFVIRHWRFFVVLIWSEKRGLARVAEMESQLPRSWQDWVIPAALAVSFGIIYPLIARAYATYTKWQYELQLTREMSIADVAKQKRENELYEKRIERASKYNMRVSNYGSLMIDVLQEGFSTGVLGKFELDKLMDTAEKAARVGTFTNAQEALNGLLRTLNTAIDRKSLPSNYVAELLRSVELLLYQDPAPHNSISRVDEFNKKITQFRQINLIDYKQ